MVKKRIYVIYSSMSKSLGIMKENKLSSVLMAGVDLAFFIVFGIIYARLALMLLEHLSEVSSIISQRIATLQIGSVTQPLTDLAAQQEILNQHVFASLKIGLVMLAVFYVCWTLFQGFNWRKSYELVHKDQKINLFHFYKRFAVVSLVFFLGFGIIVYGLLQLLLLSMQSFLSGAGKAIASVFVYLMMFLLIYLLSTSYALIGKQSIKDSLKKTFVIGYRKAVVLVPVFVLVLLLFYIAANLVILASVLSQLFGLLIALLLILPLIVWSRIYLIHTIKKLEK
jgi:hypothetical protein